MIGASIAFAGVELDGSNRTSRIESNGNCDVLPFASSDNDPLPIAVTSPAIVLPSIVETFAEAVVNDMHISTAATAIPFSSDQSCAG